MFNNQKAFGSFSLLRGIVAALGLALAAVWIESLLSVPLMGASLIALLIGLMIRLPKTYNSGLKFTSKRLLKVAIILLGASLNIGIIISVGKTSLWVMLFTLLTCFGGGYIIGKALGLDWKLSNLISAGTGICGGSAIAAIAPVIEADDSQVAYAMSATFLFDMAMIFLFPIMGRAMNLSDMAYGLWTGTAVNDTSSVIAAAYAFSENAGEIATMVKLTRTLSIIPTVIIFALIMSRQKKKEAQGVSLVSLFPWFILAFVGMSVLNTTGVIGVSLAGTLKSISKFMMVMALAAIGLQTDVKDMKQAGIKPMLHGFIISLLVVIVSLAVAYFMGIV